MKFPEPQTMKLGKQITTLTEIQYYFSSLICVPDMILLIFKLKKKVYKKAECTGR